MKCSDFFVLTAGVALATLAGCADPAITTRHSVASRAPVDAQANPNQYVTTRESVKDRPFELPENFSPGNWRHMVIGVNPRKNIYSSASSYFTQEDLRFMGSSIQSELAKLKRFSIQDIEDADRTDIEDLADVGQVRLRQKTKQPTITHVAQWNIQMNASSVRTGSYSKRLTFVCTITFKLTDLATNELVEDTTFDVDIVATQELDSMGRIKSGFNWNSRADISGVVQKLCRQASIKIANILGNENPCGGRVTGCLGDRAMVMENGRNQGIFKGMQMMVFAVLDGVPVPLGYADAQPGTNTTKLDLWRLNEEDPWARSVLESLRADRSTFRQFDLQAVSVGEALPPEWRRGVLTIETDY